jgi:hypothetical protein
MVGCGEVLQGGAEAADFVDIDLDAHRVTMVTCDNIERSVPFIVERVRVDLGRLKVSADRREPESTPIYFKSRYLVPSLLAAGMFEEGVARECYTVKA